MISIIAKWLTGNVFGTLVDLYEKKLDAENSRDSKAAEIAIKQIESDIDSRAVAKEVRLATAGFWEMRAITFLIASPFVLHLWAVGLDTVFKLGWGVPKFPAPFDQWEGTVLLSFFGVQIAGKAIDTMAYVFGRRK